MHNAPRTLSRAAGLAAALAFVQPAAHAAPPVSEAELHAARALFAEARELEEVDRWADALAKFRQVARVRMTPQVRFHIALCLEQLGRIASALEAYEQAHREARGIAPIVVIESRQRIAALRERVPHVTVSIHGDPAGLMVVLDDELLPMREIGRARRVDPGPHTVKALRQGVVVAAVTFSVAEGKSKPVTLTILPPAREPVAAGAAAPPEPRAAARPAAVDAGPVLREGSAFHPVRARGLRAAHGATAPARLGIVVPGAGASAQGRDPGGGAPPAEPPGGTRRTAQLTIGWMTLGLGGASLFAGGVTAILQARADDEFEQRCPSRLECEPSLRAVEDRGATYATLTNVFTAVGVLGVGAGLALLVTAPAAAARGGGGQVTGRAWFTPSSGGVAVDGSF